MYTRRPLLAVLLAGLALAGCKSEPPAEPVGPEEPPTEEAIEPGPETADEPKPGGADLAAAVGHAPADATLVLAVANLGELETNLKALLGEAADEMNIVQELTGDLPADAFDAGGPLVLILPDGLEGPAAVLVLPVKDAAAVKGEDAGAGIVQMKVGEEGAEHPNVFALALEAWALLAQDSAEPIKAVMRAEKKVQLSDAQKAALADHMVWVHLNTPRLAAFFREQTAEARQRTKSQGGQGGPPQAALDMVDALLDTVKDVTAVEVVGDVTAEAIQARADLHLAEGSPLAALAGTGVAMDDYKVGLPMTDRFLAAAWAGLDWEKAIPPVKTLMKPIFDTLTKGQDEKTRKAIDELWAAYEKWGPVMGDHVGMVLEAPPEGGGGVYHLAETFDLKDPDAYRQLLKEYVDASGAFMEVMMSGFGMGGPGTPGQALPVETEMTFKEAAETIEGVPVDEWRFAFTVNLPENAPPQAAAQVKQMIETMYGPDGLVFWMAVVGDKGVATMGDKDLMARAIKAAKGEAPDLVTDPRIADALKHVPEGQPVALLSAANYLHMAMAMADRMLARQVPPEVLAGAEKAGHGPVPAPTVTDLVRLTGEAAAARLSLTIHVPKSDLRAAVETAEKGAERMQFLMQKMQEKAQQQPSGKAQPAPQAQP